MKFKEDLAKKTGIMTMKIAFEVILYDRDIDIFISSVWDGCNSAWCDEVKASSNSLKNDRDKQISLGGYLLFHNFKDEKIYTLTKKKFLKGLELYLKNPTKADILEFIDHKLRIDLGCIDAEVTDAVIQYALFGHVIYDR